MSGRVDVAGTNMAGDAAFVWGTVPTGIADRVQRRAVLYPLAGPHSFDDVPLLAEKLVHQRRSRLSWLRERNAFTEQSDYALQVWRNCPPAFGQVAPRMRYCNLFWCPFCHARWVKDVWYSVTTVLPLDVADDPPPDTGEQLDVITAITPRTTPPYELCYYETRRQLILHGKEFPNQEEWVFAIGKRGVELRQDVWKQARQTAAAAWAYMTIEPNEAGWLLNRRMLFAVPYGQTLGGAWTQPVEDYDAEGQLTYSVKFSRYQVPTPRVLFNAVTQFTRYPTSLLRCMNTEQMLSLLRARSSREVCGEDNRWRRRAAVKFYATFGKVRGQHDSDDDS